MILPRRLIYRGYIVAGVLTFVLVFYFVIYQKLPDNSSVQVHNRNHVGQLEPLVKLTGPVTKENLGERLSIIIREFENFDNALSETVRSIPDQLPYPPVMLNMNSEARVITLSSDLTRNYSSACPFHYLQTQYVLIIPDAVGIRDWKLIQNLVSFLHSKKHTKAVAVPIGNAELTCQGLSVDLKSWSLSFHANYSQPSFNCPLVTGPHGLFMETETLKSFAEPFARPLPLTFYIQASVKNCKVRITKSARLDVLSRLYQEPHSHWKHKQAETDRLRKFYEKIGIKQETLASGFSNWYGCSKETARCFGTIVNDMPEYLYLGRWTPPCCLKALRETAWHVFSVLDRCQVRYWLEGGSLLGAARHGDIIPWDYDVDIGIYKVDVEKCLPLSRATQERYVDEQQFVWETAVEGDFFRVQFSETNHLHVDIFPFYSKNGTMTKDTWFHNHRQDTEFPERFLQPLTKIEFAGVLASAPNNITEFLEYKFGQGVIDKPKYPNFQNPL
ncbi:unnamed protein product [Candidula unifasciata]|uniref:Fukutin-related protein n=1 Tax=Candidula unifasciata TaxID=100452 RepID=A0A8S3Z9B1_9EUPU|nr:unnamed protein product [Candidula unifasciata]